MVSPTAISVTRKETNRLQSFLRTFMELAYDLKTRQTLDSTTERCIISVSLLREHMNCQIKREYDRSSFWWTSKLCGRPVVSQYFAKFSYSKGLCLSERNSASADNACNLPSSCSTLSTCHARRQELFQLKRNKIINKRSIKFGQFDQPQRETYLRRWEAGSVMLTASVTCSTQEPPFRITICSWRYAHIQW